MKQFAFLILVTFLAGVGSMISPFWPVLLYYGLAILRPQHIWDWALPIHVRWSFIAAGLILFSVFLHHNHLLRISRVNLVTKLMVLYGVLIVFAMVAALDPNMAQTWAVEYAKVLVIAVIAGLVITQFWQIRLITVMILLTCGFLAWEINYMYFFQNRRLDIFHYGYGGLDNNGAGLSLAMAIPFAYCFTLIKGQGHWRYLPLLALPLGVLLLHALMMTYSRGSMLACMIGMAWLLFHHRPRWQSFSAMAVLCVLVPVLAGQEIQDRFLSTRDYQSDASAQSRFDSWRAGWNLAWDYPVFGTGIRNSHLQIHHHAPELRGRTIHNQYIQIAADTGIPSVIVYLTIMGLAWFAFRRARILFTHRWLEMEKKNRDGPQTVELNQASLIFLALESSLLIFALGGMFLSIELFEMPWLLLVLGGVTPIAARHLIEQCQPEQSTAPHKPEPQNRKKHAIPSPAMAGSIRPAA